MLIRFKDNLRNVAWLDPVNKITVTQQPTPYGDGDPRELVQGLSAVTLAPGIVVFVKGTPDEVAAKINEALTKEVVWRHEPVLAKSCPTCARLESGAAGVDDKSCLNCGMAFLHWEAKA